MLNNLSFTAWPEMLTWPYLLLKGFLPYRDIAIAHNPLMLFDLTIFYKIFGVGIWQLKVFTWLLILFTGLVLFGVTKKLWNRKVATVALFFYFPLVFLYDGNGLWFDLALAPPGLVIFYLLRKKDYFWAGVFWALAFLTKQTAFWFLVPISLVVYKKPKAFIKGVLLIFAVFLVILYFLGIGQDFYFWALQFGIGILPRSAGQLSAPSLRQFLLAFLPFLPLVFLGRKNWQILVWALFGLMGAFPRWELFHFQPALPFLAIGLGLLFADFRKFRKPLQMVFVLYLLGLSFLVFKACKYKWQVPDRFVEREVLEVADYISNNTSENETIYVLNAWDSLYALADRLPATRPLVPHLAWYMEMPGIQEEIVSDLESERPALIIQGEYEDVGLGAYKPALIADFMRQNYQVKDRIGKYLILVPK